MTLKCKAFACLLSLTALAISACGSSTESHANMTSLENADSGFTFTAKNRTARQELPSDLRSPQDYKFVEVVVVDVVNPKQHAIRFEVHYRPPNEGTIFLGTFSLFPADNPGSFIVPTQGKLRSEGELILSLVLPEDVPMSDALRITTRNMTLRRASE